MAPETAWNISYIIWHPSRAGGNPRVEPQNVGCAALPNISGLSSVLLSALFAAMLRKDYCDSRTFRKVRHRGIPQKQQIVKDPWAGSPRSGKPIPHCRAGGRPG